MSAQLQTELLAFFHDPAVNDGEARSATNGDGGERKGRDRNIRPGVVLSACARDLAGWFPTDGPKGIAAVALQFERRFVFDLEFERRFAFNTYGRAIGGMQRPQSQ